MDERIIELENGTPFKFTCSKRYFSNGNGIYKDLYSMWQISTGSKTYTKVNEQFSELPRWLAHKHHCLKKTEQSSEYEEVLTISLSADFHRLNILVKHETSSYDGDVRGEGGKVMTRLESHVIIRNQ